MPVITAPNATVYDQVYACSSPLIYHYRQDLETHDKDWIESNPGVPFIHMTRSTGTQLIPLYPHDHKGWPKAGENVSWLFGHTDRFGVLEGRLSIITAVSEPHEFLYYSGSSLSRCSEDQAQTIIDSYRVNIKHAWVTYKVFSVDRYLAGSRVPAGQYTDKDSAIAHTETVTYPMFVLDSRGQECYRSNS